MALSTFWDHLTAIDSSRFGTITAGSGSVTQTGSRVEIRANANNDAAALYLKDPIDLNVSQIVAFAFSYSGSIAGLPFYIINKASAPAAEGNVAFNARRLAAATSADAVAFTFLRWSNAGTQNSWSTPLANWSTGASRYSVTPVGVGDYYIVAFENDAVNARWRLHGYCLQASAWGDAKTQGLVQVALTDWTTWANTRASSDGVYLILGDPINDANTVAIDVEWVRASTEAVTYAALNGKDDGGTYSIKLFQSYDGGRFLLPYDRSSSMLTGNVKDPWVVDPGAGTVHLFYTDIATNGIKRATASSITGTFTVQNAIATPPANHQFGFACVMHTPHEGAGYEWQAIVQDLDQTDSNHISLRLFTTNDPATVGWTDRGIIVSYGSGADKDAQGCLSPVGLHRKGQYEIWYSGQYDPGVSMVGSFTTVSGLRAVGPGLTSAGAGLLALTKDGSGARLPYTDAQQALSANLSGTSASMTDTDGFEIDDLPILFDQDTTDNNWALSRVRSYTVDSSLTLYHKMTGLTTASGATAFAPLSGPQNIRSIRQQANGDWHVHVTICQMSKFNTTIGQVFAEFNFTLVVPAGTELENMAPSMYVWRDSPAPYLNTFGFGHSAENLSLVYDSTDESQNTGAASLTLGALTVSAAGVVTATGAASLTLGALSAAGAGAMALDGAAALALDALTTTAAGAVSVAGAASLVLDALSLSATGTVGSSGVVGDAALTLDALSVSAAGAVAVAGAASLTLGALSLAAAGTVAVAGAASVTLDALTVTGEGTVVSGRIGEAAITLGALTLSGAGAVALAGQASVTLDALTLAAVGAVAVAGSGALTLGALSLTGAGTTNAVATEDAWTTAAIIVAAPGRTIIVPGRN